MRELRDKIFNKLIGTGWDDQLRFFIKSQDFEQILEKLHQEVEQGYRFTPGVNSWMRPFELCPLDRVKVVFLVNQPYLDPTLNMGLALSVLPAPRLPIELYRLLQEIPGHSIKEGNLTPWANQGILFLNCSLTTQINKAGQHKKLWMPFLLYILQTLNRKSLLFVGFGELDCWNYIAEHHFKIKVSALPKTQDDPYSYQQLFVEINNYLKSKDISEIIW